MLKNLLSQTSSTNEQRLLLATARKPSQVFQCSQASNSNRQQASESQDQRRVSDREQQVQRNLNEEVISQGVEVVSLQSAPSDLPKNSPAQAKSPGTANVAEEVDAVAENDTSVSNPTNVSGNTQNDVQRFLGLVNNFRAQNGLPSLKSNSGVEQLAVEHSRSQANSERMSHDGFDSRGNAARQAVSGARTTAENVAYNQGASDPVTTAFNGLVNSPGHRANMLRNYPAGVTGVGIVRSSSGAYYFTQLFVG